MIEEHQRDLHRCWKEDRNYNCYIEDGVFDEREWNNQNIKILYVLKEANCWQRDSDGTCHCATHHKKTLNLCNYLLSEKSPTYWKTWNNVVRWTQAIRFGGKYQRSITKSDKSKYLKTIAALNIKKVAGGSQSDSNKILLYGKNDADYIKQQIDLYKPDIIICCGQGKVRIADILYAYVLITKSNWKKTSNGYHYFLYYPDPNKKIPVLSFQHPQMWGGHVAFKKSYDDMLKIANEFKEQTIL